MTLNQKINNIDDEWSSFLSNPSTFDEYYEETNNENTDFDCEEDIYQNNCNNSNNNSNNNNYNGSNNNNNKIFEGTPPEPTPIYISTKSKIAYLQEPIDLKLFWNIPVIPYYLPQNGVIKKQIKINSKTPEELEQIQDRLKDELYFEEHIMTHIDNPNGRIKFKDIRKITVGISKKDIMSYRSKKKQAFYNCFVMILRIKFDTTFKEFHIKVFNTGKLEIPGVQNDLMYETVLQNIIEILQPYNSYKIAYKQVSDTVLINSNFNCGFFVNREALFDILRNKYLIPAIYDPCSYPGIQCKYYFDEETQLKTHGKNKENDRNIIEVSFMIFRTGSVLIVGMCDEYILDKVYEYLTNILKTEFKYICQKIIEDGTLEKDKKKKQRKKLISIMTSCPNVNTDIDTNINIIASKNNNNCFINSETNIEFDNNNPKNIVLNEIEEIIVKKTKTSKKAIQKRVKNDNTKAELEIIH
jgi:hypothetical protein